MQKKKKLNFVKTVLDITTKIKQGGLCYFTLDSSQQALNMFGMKFIFGWKLCRKFHQIKLATVHLPHIHKINGVIFAFLRDSQKLSKLSEMHIMVDY